MPIAGSVSYCTQRVMCIRLGEVGREAPDSTEFSIAEVWSSVGAFPLSAVALVLDRGDLDDAWQPGNRTHVACFTGALEMNLLRLWQPRRQWQRGTTNGT